MIFRVLKDVFLIVSLFLYATLTAGNDKYLYVYFDSSDGLSQDEVTSITQDHNGVMWFATRGGLNSFDGHHFRVIRPVFDQQNTLISSSIEKIFTDSKGRIWIGYKKGGVSVYHPNNNWLEHIHMDSFNEDGRVISFLEDDDGKIYIGQWESGLTIYDYDNDIQTRLLGNHRILDMGLGNNNTVWIGTNNGLLKLNNRTLEQKWIREIRNEITSIEIDTANSCLWLGYWGNKLIKYDYATSRVTRIQDAKERINNIYSLLSISREQLLVGTWGSGLWLFNKTSNTFNPLNISAQSFSKSPFLYKSILALYQDKQKNIWIGSNGDGIVMQKERQNLSQYQLIGEDRTTKPVSQIIQDIHGTYFLAADNLGIAYSNDLIDYKWISISDDKKNSRISCLYVLNDDKIILGASDKSLQIITREGNDYHLKKAKINKQEALLTRKLTSAVKSRNKNMHWLGTQQRGLILTNINSETDDVKIVNRFHAKHQNKKYCLSDSRVSALVSDSLLWIGTYGGLDYYDYKTDSIVHFSNEDIVGSLSDKIILSLSIDKEGNIWCGTPSGLNKIYHERGLWKIQYYGIKNGLPNAYVTGVIHDANHMLWVSTNKGLAVYDPKSDRFNAYVKGQMSGSLRFYENSLCLNNNGEAVFGGIDGITICKDNFSSHKNTENNSLYLSSVKLSGKELKGRIKIDGKEYYIPTANELDKLQISHKTKQIEFNVATLDFVNLGSIRYEYSLSTKSKPNTLEWNLMRTDGVLRFDNLNSGHYNLHIRTVNIFDNTKGKERLIKLIIPPPPYRSWWAYSIYAALILVIFIMIVYLFRLKHNAHLEALKRTQQEELNQIQTQAFVNISHEFKTPLTIISAFVKELISKKDEHKLDKSVLKKLNSIAMSSKRMNDLIIDLSTFRKSEKKGLEINVTYVHLPSFVHQLTQPFAEIVEISGGRLSVKCNKGSQHIMIDGEKLQILLNNLLSNAIKFSPDTPKVKLYINAYQQKLTLKVEDKGIGIPAEQLDKIFDRFYRVSSKVSGSGIGLALVKQIVDIQHGTININSEEQKGTSFHIELPYSEADEATIAAAKEKSEKEIDTEETVINESPAQEKPSKDKPQILLVEDKPQMMQLMESILSTDYTVLKASDGLEGYKQAKLTQPKLIISDIAMPYGDGVQLLMKIRENKKLESTPVLIVTGQDDQETILKCFENGADDVLKKPFDPTLFKTKVESLLQMRKRLKEVYSQKIQLSSSKEEVSPKQAIFITQLMSTIEKNVNNPQLGLPFLAEQFSLSSSGLYRKVKNATGRTVVDLIKTVKIDTACTLLRDTQRNIDDISFEAGFSDVRYFQKCFKEEKGMTPGEYRKNFK